MTDQADAVAAHEYRTWQESAKHYINNVAPLTAKSGQISILIEVAAL